MVVSWLQGRRTENLATATIMAMISEEERQHLERIKRRWKIYRGDHPKPLRVRTYPDGSKGADDNVVVNYARDIVDTGVSFLFGEAPEFTLDEGEKSARETWLDNAWNHNRLVETLQKDALNGAVCGHSFIRLYPPNLARYGHEYPRIVILDPATVWPTWDDDDIDVVNRYRIQFNGLDARTRRPVVKRTIIALGDDNRWTITDQQTDPNGSGWITLSSVVWGWPWCPVVHCQNLPVPNEFWGISDLEDDMLTGQNALNFLASNMQRIIRNHAHPKSWATGVAQGTVVDMSPDTVAMLTKDATLQNLEMNSDLASSLEYLKWFAQSLVTTNRVPEIALGVTDEPGNLSGVALQIKFWPLIAKTQQKRTIRESYLADINMRLFDLAGKGKDIRPAVGWPEILPSDAKAEREAAAIDHELGASKETLLTKFGYDWETEKTRREAEDKAAQELGGTLIDDFVRGGRPAEERGQRQAGVQSES